MEIHRSPWKPAKAFHGQTRNKKRGMYGGKTRGGASRRRAVVVGRFFFRRIGGEFRKPGWNRRRRFPISYCEMQKRMNAIPTTHYRAS